MKVRFLGAGVIVGIFALEWFLLMAIGFIYDWKIKQFNKFLLETKQHQRFAEWKKNNEYVLKFVKK